MMNTIIKCKYALISLMMIVLNGAGAKASAPWTINPGDYRYDMSLYLQVAFANSEMDYDNYEIGAFCNDECRGIAEPFSVGDDVCLYLRVKSNIEEGETITLKYYNKQTEKVNSADGVSFTFVSNGLIGYPSDPYKVIIIIYHDVVLSAGKGGKIDNEGGRYQEGSQITVTATPDEGYSFSEWSDNNTDNPRTITVDDDVDLTANFEANKYLLTYVIDGVTVYSEKVAYETVLTPFEAPEKEGYSFDGWTGLPETMPAKDVTVTGAYSINSYKLTFMIDDEVIQESMKEYGSPLSPIEAPEKDNYTFDGWTGLPETMPAKDVIVTGSYTRNGIIGDVDHSGKINVGDAIMIVNYVVGIQNSKFDSNYADVNGDEKINVADAIWVVNLVVGIVSEFPVKAPANTTESQLVSVSMEAVSHDEVYYDVTVKTDCTYNFSAIQTAIVIPAGFEYVPQSLSLVKGEEGTFMAVNEVDQNLVKVAAISLNSKKISDDYGSLLTFRVKRNDDAISDTDLWLKEIELADASCRNLEAEDVCCPLNAMSGIRHENLQVEAVYSQDGSIHFLLSEKQTVVIQDLKGFSRRYDLPEGLSVVTVPSGNVYLISTLNRITKLLVK